MKARREEPQQTPHAGDFAATARERLVAARREACAARREFAYLPSDLSRERVVQAEVYLDDALAVAQEWLVAETPGSEPLA